MNEKLVRDKIPEIIRARGDTGPSSRVAGRGEYRALLARKLQEETAEYVSAPAIEELADIMEVVYALAEEFGCSREELERIRREKEKTRGGFRARIVMNFGPAESC